MNRISPKVAVAAAVAAAAAGGLAQSAAARTTAWSSAQDRTYLTTAMQGDRFEIEGAALALKRSTNPDVRRIARVLARDHSASLKDAAEVAHPRGVQIPHQPTPTQRWQLDTLRKADAQSFDRAYLTLEVKDHQQDISEATTESQEGSDASVVEAARGEIGTLHRHLRLCHGAYVRLGT